MKMLISAAVFFCSALFVYAAALIIYRRKIIRGMSGKEELSFAGRIADMARYLKKTAVDFNKVILKNSRDKNTEILLKKAGKEEKNSPGYFLLIRQAYFFIFFILGAMISGSFIFVLAAGFSGFFLPLVMLRAKVRKKEAEIINELPEALDIIAASIEGGLSLSRSVSRYAAKNRNALAFELSGITGAMQLGKTFADALREIDEKYGIRELSGFVRVFIQAEKTGGNIKKIIKERADEMRKKKFQALKKRAHEAPVKLLIPLVLFIFPVVFIVLFGSIVIKLMQGF